MEGLAVGQFDAGALGFLGEGEGELPLPFHQQGRLNLWLCRFPLGTIGEGIGGIGQVFQLEGDLTHGESTVVPQEVKEEVEAAAIGRSSQELCTSPNWAEKPMGRHRCCQGSPESWPFQTNSSGIYMG